MSIPNKLKPSLCGISILLVGIFQIIAQKQDEHIQHRVFLLANTADLPINTNFYAAFHQLLEEAQTPFSIIANGDLVSFNKDGTISTPDSFRVDQLILASQGFKDGKLIIIPGDRDWASSGTQGWKSVQSLERLVVSKGYPHVEWAISQGCPGPETLELDGGLRLIAFQSQWWNHPFSKPQAADASCQIGSKDAFLEEFQRIIDESQGKNVLIAGHYPFMSLGEYGGNFGLKKQLFPLTDFDPKLYVPLPVLGNLYTAFRQNIGTRKDIVNQQFDGLREGLQELIQDNHSLMYLSGHESNMQILHLGDNYLINSGAIGKNNYVAKAHTPDFSLNHQGLIELVYKEHGDIFANIYQYTEKRGFEQIENRFLFQSVCHVGDSVTPFNTAHLLCGDNPGFYNGVDYYDSIVQKEAGLEYKAGKVQQLFWGKHYRDAWTQKVNIAYANLDTLRDGLEAMTSNLEEGTHGLRFWGNNGREYLFRSINKSPLRHLSYELRNSIIGYIIKDQTSTQHPYGALITHPLMKALGILHPKPFLYLLPKDDKLGILGEDFGDMIGFLEENPRMQYSTSYNFAGANNIVRSHKFLSYRYEWPQLRIDKKAYAKARLFDIWVGDWDRREDNWKWALFPSEEEMTIARPVVYDRDQAFSKWDGFFPWLADREWMRPDVQNFGGKIKGIRSLTWHARHLDRLLATELTKLDWFNVAEEVVEVISDSLIESAVRALPKEIYHLDGPEIEEKLKSRRSELQAATLKFYELLAKEVDVVGTNQNEIFEVKRLPNGGTLVRVYHERLLDVGKFDSTTYYSRIFMPHETREIRLFGLDGSDKFYINGKASTSMKIRIIGGPGRDEIYDESFVKGQSKNTVIYEQGIRSKIEKGEEAWVIRTAQQKAYNYERTAFNYDRYYPFPSLNINSDDGFMPTIGIKYIKNAYGKSSFSSEHNLQFTYTTTKSYAVEYQGVFREVFGKWGVLLEGEWAQPNSFLNFFGFGNETVKNDSLFRANYYRTRYQSLSLSSGLMLEFWKRSHLQFRMHYENNEAQIPESSILFGEKNFLGVDRANLLFFQAYADFDFRNNPYFPEKGMRLYAGHINGFVVNNHYSNYGQTQLFLEYYTNFSKRHLPVSLALKGGIEDSYGSIPFYKQFNLGHRSNLRGYRRNRFTGTGTIYGNSELRIEIAHNHTAKIPYRLGMKGFFDIGKIIHDGENSTKWHKGYGWGFYFIPFSERAALNFSMGFSEEESILIKLSIGRIFR